MAPTIAYIDCRTTEDAMNDAYTKHECGLSGEPRFLETWPLTLVAVGFTVLHFAGHAKTILNLLGL